MPRINNVKNLQIRFADQVRNCEDMAIDTFEGFAILSCDPGRDSWNTVMVCFYHEPSKPAVISQHVLTVARAL